MEHLGHNSSLQTKNSYIMCPHKNMYNNIFSDLLVTVEVSWDILYLIKTWHSNLFLLYNVVTVLADAVFWLTV